MTNAKAAKALSILKTVISGGKATSIRQNRNLPVGGNRGNCVSQNLKFALLYKPEMDTLAT